jgi:hypothetical protein
MFQDPSSNKGRKGTFARAPFLLVLDLACGAGYSLSEAK